MLILGDPHLGRSFIHGVPLHNRGRREEMVWKAFADSVQMTKTETIHICMGDLFDKAVVPYNVIRRAADTYIHAADGSDCHFYILKGNHDWMRDLTQPSAFDIFARIVDKMPNIHIVDNAMVVGRNLLVPWHPLKNFKEQVHGLDLSNVVRAFGHWDLDSFGGSDTNVVPVKELLELGVREVFNGHIHKRQEVIRGGLAIHVVGSLQPYAHGEESDESLYVTRRYSELGDLSQYTHKCLRVVCGPKEFFDETPECLQLTIKREGEDKLESMEVDLGTFDVEAMFLKAFEDGKVSKETTDKLLGIFQSKRLSTPA